MYGPSPPKCLNCYDFSFDNKLAVKGIDISHFIFRMCRVAKVKQHFRSDFVIILINMDVVSLFNIDSIFA